MKKYEDHKKIYDITDMAAGIVSEFARISKVIDTSYTIPNSLQAMLGKIYRYEGKTQSDLSKIYNIDYQNTVRSIRELKERGLVRKVPLDKRRKGIYLTKEGSALNDYFMQERGEFLDVLLSEVDHEKLKITKETLEKILEVMTTYDKKH